MTKTEKRSTRNVIKIKHKKKSNKKAIDNISINTLVYCVGKRVLCDVFHAQAYIGSFSSLVFCVYGGVMFSLPILKFAVLLSFINAFCYFGSMRVIKTIWV